MNPLSIKRSWALLPTIVGTVVIIIAAVLAGSLVQSRTGAAPPTRLAAAEPWTSDTPSAMPGPSDSGTPAPSDSALPWPSGIPGPSESGEPWPSGIPGPSASDSAAPSGMPAPSGTPAPSNPAPTFEPVVTYEVTGDGPVDIDYNDDNFAHLSVPGAVPPWQMSFPSEGPLMVVAAQRKSSDLGGVQCRIYKFGVLRAVRSATGPFSRVGCVLTDE